jgi:myosin heavy subunit
VLHLGNIRFRDANVRGAESSEIDRTQRSEDALRQAATLLQIQPNDLSQRLRMRELTIRGEVSYIQLKATQAAEARDALCKALYNKNFDWLVTRINQAMSCSRANRSIGILDIFGFEIFQVNSFEQLCINYANEKLQQHFNLHTFKTEEDTYRSEGVPFDSVPYIDNQDVLDLIEMKPVGVFSCLC